MAIQSHHGILLRQFQEFGGLNAVPEELRERYVKWLSRCFIGEPGGYGQGINRKVFYSNSADPLIREIFGSAPAWVSGTLAFLRKENDMAAAMKRGDSIARRDETLVDLAEGRRQPLTA